MSTVAAEEISHFAKDSARWWDESGPFAPLHRLNPVRLRFIRTAIAAQFGCEETSIKPFTTLKILDVGCGGGIVCEPLARLGAQVHGIDADAQAIAVAKAHAKESGLDIRYDPQPVENIKGTYDVVTALEIAEHVANVDKFVENLSARIKPGGLLIMSTLNRNPKSFLLGVIAAEYILRWVPRGTHNWKKFLKPSELARAARRHGLATQQVKGLIFNPVSGDFELSDKDLDVNYLMTLRKL